MKQKILQNISSALRAGKGQVGIICAKNPAGQRAERVELLPRDRTQVGGTLVLRPLLSPHRDKLRAVTP